MATQYRQSGVASALSGATPLRPPPYTSGHGPVLEQNTTPAAAPRKPLTGATQRPLAGPPIQPPAPIAATPTPYDINTDPILAQITAFLGQGDEEASSNALAQKKKLAIQYGDAGLARNLIDEDTASAAEQNPTSILAGLRGQHDRNSAGLTEALNKNNLFYGGYRVTQEQQAQQDYLDALAHAAGDVQGGFSNIGNNLASALSQNARDRMQARIDAAGRHTDTPGASLPPASGTPHDLFDQPTEPFGILAAPTPEPPPFGPHDLFDQPAPPFGTLAPPPSPINPLLAALLEAQQRAGRGAIL